jgi:hypothetical protein
MADDQIKLLNQRWGALKQERSSWMGQWMDVSANLLPVNGRYFISDRNRGFKRFNTIYDSTGTRALRILSAGMMSGMTSPSRPWFRLSVSDTDLMQYQPVKVWLNAVTDQVGDVMAKSNLYRVLHSMYEELGAFGTSAALIADDYKNVIHLHPFTIGEYAIATNWKGEVTTLYREFDNTVGAIVKEFGLDNCSSAVKSAYQRGALDQWITLVHAIEPRTDRDPAKKDSINMPWRSVYFERASTNKSVLRESGYKSFPCVCPRWQTAGGDIYGVSPGMEALGDIKGLQSQEFRKLLAIDYQSNPPIQVPSSMKNRETELFPGGVSYYDAQAGSQGIKTAYEVPLNISNLLASQQDTRQRVNAAFFSDLFMMISGQDTGRMTATEVTARNEEKMLMLGPVVERLNNELLDPLVETVFERLLTANLLPPPPEELQGHDLNIEYVSMLSQAQKSVATNSIDRFVGALGQLAQIRPDILDKFDPDHWVDLYSDKLGIDPELIIPGEQVAMIRQQRAASQQQAQQQEAMMNASQTVKNLGQTSTQPGTASGDLLNKMQGQP